MKKKSKTMENFAGLEWLTITGVPVVKTKYGDAVEASVLKKMEELAATYIVEKRVPIRGLEVVFLRKTFGYSMGRLSADLEYSSTAILKWERAKHKRLDKVNEIVLRTWVAEQLKLEISGRFSKLWTASSGQDPVILKAA